MKKRIGLISEHASPLAILGGVDGGGQNVYVGEVARHLIAAGYEVDVFTRRDSVLLPEVAEWVNGVRLIHVPAGPPEYVRKEDLLSFMPEFTAYVQQFCQRQRHLGSPYALFHANFWMSGLVAADLKAALGIPFVITFHALGKVRRFHQGEADEFPDQRFAVEERIVHQADHIIAECPQEEADLVRFYNANSRQITIIPGGFDQGQFCPIGKTLARVALGLDPEERIVLQLGRMVPRKGVDVVIQGFARFLKQQPMAARLVIVGGDADDPQLSTSPEMGRLREIAQAAGILDRVLFVGRRGREALKWYYSAADVFVTTPWYEPFGITPLEAMACGTPVIGSNVGGIKFTVRDGETGYLVPPNNPEAIADRLHHLYQHPDLLQTFRHQAIRRANDLFTWERVTQSIADLYEQVIAQTQTQPANHSQSLALVDRGFENALVALQRSRRQLRTGILQVAEVLNTCFAHQGKLLICGNGGSASDAQHLAAEFIGRFKLPNRRGLPAIALTADTAVITAWANDMGYEEVFARQVEALGQPGDVLLGISTSGSSRNLLQAFEVARRQGLSCVALLGKDGGDLHAQADYSLIVPATDTQHIQEVHLVVLHLLCELVEERLQADSCQVWEQYPLSHLTSRLSSAAAHAVVLEGPGIVRP